MTNNSSGVDMIDLQNAIDSEFEVAQMANSCGRSTNMLFNRVDGLTGKQLEIKSILETLDAQIRQAEESIMTNRKLFGEVNTCTSGTSTTMIETLLSSVDNVDRRLSTNDSTTNNVKSPSSTRSRSVSTERRSISGGKDSPIIIDDEVEEVFPRTISRNSRTSSEDSATATVNIRPQPMILPAEREVMANNARRRPKIIENELQAGHFEDRDSSCLSTESGVPLVPRELSLANVVQRLSSNEISRSPSPDALAPNTRMSAAIAVPTSFSTGGNGSSTESATSSLNERSQSSIELDEFETSQGDVVYSSPVSTSSSPVIPSQRTLRSKEVQPSFASHIISRRPHSPTDYIVGSRVLGKRSSDIWFPGEVTKIMPDKHRQTKYSIKYDKGQKGVLSLNHICPEAPAMVVDLCVGSRVVGLYGRLDLWYAGIVAEMPCSDNRKRFLIFFDDGFAQYLSAKKLHKVHHKGKNVWEDVTEHSRDFIQEYLEDYPSRPMLHVRVGQWIRTEWMGQWLSARVLSVDGSLIKMLFQIDNRSEWIYRGSTRLDPLYRALVLGEKTTSAKARSRKLTRNASSKGNAPYIEYNTTKPSFGISPYSKTDPKGIQQLQLEELRKRTQLQQQETTDTSKLQPTKATTTVEKTAKQEQNESLTEAKHRVETMPVVDTTEALLVPKTELVIESTYSCIQASTLRKRTGVSLVNNIIFKANESSEEPSPMSTPAKPPSANITPLPHHPPLPQDPPLHHRPPLPHHPPNLKTVDQVKPKGKSGPWKAPWLNLDQRNKQRHVDDNVVKPEAGVQASKPRDVASILKNKLDASSLKEETATVKPAFATPKLESVGSLAGPHTCSSACAQYRSDACIDHLRQNPLAMPIFLDWKREVVKRRGKTSKRDVYYRTPCHRRLRNMAEVLHYLTMTRDTSLVIDQFTFDWRVRTKDTMQSFPMINDISNGQEKRPLPAVNEVDNERPPDVVKYVSERTLASGVDLCKEPGFMVCCDCEDSCSDSSKCACIQLTIQGCKAMDAKNPEKAIYQYKRLKDCVQTGIYECNSQCSCNKNCLNRLVQNGIQIRLEIFKTENRGWGVRAVDDVPVGTFICTYAGYLLNEELANQEGRDYGDEYMAELDYIEVAEKAKEGYESGVSDFEEDDNVIHEMLTFDENLPDSENSDHSSFENEVLEQDDEEEEEEEDDDEEEEEEEDESDDDIASSSDNCSLNSGDEDSFRQIRKALRSSKRKKVFKSQQKKKRGTASEESLVVERESKANVLSRLGDPLMCILALKRNGNDLKKSARFLRKLVIGNGEDGETMDMNDKHCAPMNGVSFSPTNEIAGVENGRPVLVSTSDFDLDDLSDDALADIHGNRDRLNSASNERALDEEKQSGVGERDKSPPTKEVEQQGSTLMEGLETNDTTSSPNNGTTVEDVGITKEDVPELLSAEDLKRLAASEPKSIEPPLLSKAGETRRGTVLNETIEKLKKRVVTSDSSFSDTQIVSENNATTENTHEIRDENSLMEQVNASSEAVAIAKAGSGYGSGTASSSNISEKSSSLDEKELDVLDDDKRSVQSESSLLSRNSSSVSQSVSSRCSSPAMEVSNRLARNSGKVQRTEKPTQKDDKSETNNSSLTKHVKTRSLFKEEHCYVIDAKTYGNCGRFLNHSCTPNLFVQNVFVDTHDLRFPRVAFFAQQNIKAGTELSWDYMYEVGSVRDKVLHCLCGSSECRGRLL